MSNHVVENVAELLEANREEVFSDDLEALHKVWGPHNGRKAGEQLEDAYLLSPEFEASVSEVMAHNHGKAFRLSFYANHHPSPVLSLILTRDDLRRLVGMAAEEVYETVMLSSRS